MLLGTASTGGGDKGDFAFGKIDLAGHDGDKANIGTQQWNSGKIWTLQVLGEPNPVYFTDTQGGKREYPLTMIKSPNMWLEMLTVDSGHPSWDNQTLTKQAHSEFQYNSAFVTLSESESNSYVRPKANTDWTLKGYTPEEKKGCFTGESLVQMADGSEKRIDAVQTGDRVISGLTGKAVQVVVVDVVHIADEPMLMVGFNGLEPFSTTTHCFFTAAGLRTSYDPAASIQAKHWRPEEIEPLVEGSVIRATSNTGKNGKTVQVDDIRLCNISNTVVYNLLTTDHSYVVNGFCVSDDFPDLMARPVAAIRIYFLLKKIQGLEAVRTYKEAVDYADLDQEVDVSRFPEYFAEFMQLCQKHSWATRIADELWTHEIDRFDHSL